MSLVECPKCGGQGWFKEYSHIASGTCFKCGGAGKVDPKTIVERNRGECKLTDEDYELDQRRIDFILNAEDEHIASMSWKQIWKARQFVMNGAVHEEKTLTQEMLEETWHNRFEKRFLELADA